MVHWLGAIMFQGGAVSLSSGLYCNVKHRHQLELDRLVSGNKRQDLEQHLQALPNLLTCPFQEAWPFSLRLRRYGGFRRRQIG
jgi:hypothetical protein